MSSYNVAKGDCCMVMCVYYVYLYLLSGVVNSHPSSDGSHDIEVTIYNLYKPEVNDMPCTSMNYTSVYTRDVKCLFNFVG